METLEELEKLRDKKKYELFLILKKQDKRKDLDFKKKQELLLVYEIMNLNKLIKEKNGKK